MYSTVNQSAGDIVLASLSANSGWTIPAGNTLFTVPTTGTYMISYSLQAVTSGGCGIEINGVPLVASSFICAAGLNSSTLIFSLAAGATINLTTLGTGISGVGGFAASASLTITRVA